MLGCHDFCGYYDWTFAFLRKHFGEPATVSLWEHAIGGESQQHYLIAGQKAGLQGLYDTWVTTGVDEKCDWTFTVDIERNVLRTDMRQCPSKGFLLGNDLVADEDYCDHCEGWITPLLKKLNVGIVGHEHNHAGQCWFELADLSRPSQSPTSFPDIRKDPRWQQGYLDHWQRDEESAPKISMLPQVSKSADTPTILQNWFDRVSHLHVIGRGPSAQKHIENDHTGVLVADPTYATRDVYAGNPLGVLIGDRSSDDTLRQVANRFHDTPPEDRPLLMNAYLPRANWPKWEQFGLPRPVPILPLILRAGLYEHDPNGAYPTTGTLMILLAAALKKIVTASGIDLYQTPGSANRIELQLPHSLACEIANLRKARELAGDQLTLIGQATRLL